jgi:hypothetical protein
MPIVQQRVQLGHKHVDLSVVRILEIEPWAHGKGEEDTVAGGGIGQRFEACQRRLVVGRTPIVAM